MMLQNLKEKMKEQKGFTLIELLAVIVILGILAAIAIPSITQIINNSKVNAIKADGQLILNAAKLYVTENGMPAATVNNGKIIALDLEPKYLDNVSSFTGTSSDGTAAVPYTIELNGSGELAISGIGVNGGQKFEFTSDTIADLK